MSENNKTEPLIAIMQKMVQQSARERAISLRWNMICLTLTYAMIVIILLLDHSDLEAMHLMAIAGTGITSIACITYWRERRLSRRESEFLTSIFYPLASSKNTLKPDFSGFPDCGLTVRELQILANVVQGKSDKEIANILNLSQYTVRNHLRNVYQKLAVKDRTSAAVVALNSGLIKLNGEKQNEASSENNNLTEQESSQNLTAM